MGWGRGGAGAGEGLMECQEVAPSAWAGWRERESGAGPLGMGEMLWPDAASREGA